MNELKRKAQEVRKEVQEIKARTKTQEEGTGGGQAQGGE
jgi:hypothetical protein